MRDKICSWISGSQMEIHLKDGRSISIPDEIIVNIFSFLDPSSILNCRSVCHNWKVLVESDLWRLKLTPEVFHLIVNLKNNRWAWAVGYKMWLKQPFGRNLLKNNCGQEYLNYWTETSSCMVKDSSSTHFCWSIETPPIGCKDLPPTADCLQDSCFVTSYLLCSKSQCINLETEGMYYDILDAYQPPIEVIEWHGSRTDAGCMYRLIVSLCTEDFDIITSFHYEDETERWNDGEWKKVEHTFLNYGPHVRFIYFTHMGKDKENWYGMYGAKMTGASVRIHIPQKLR